MAVPTDWRGQQRWGELWHVLARLHQDGPSALRGASGRVAPWGQTQSGQACARSNRRRSRRWARPGC
eukprot:4626015-Alexandrium_andersonii.AAC.1